MLFLSTCLDNHWIVLYLFKIIVVPQKGEKNSMQQSNVASEFPAVMLMQPVHM